MDGRITTGHDIFSCLTNFIRAQVSNRSFPNLCHIAVGRYSRRAKVFLSFYEHCFYVFSFMNMGFKLQVDLVQWRKLFWIG